MTIEELNKILLNGEDVRTEYKQSWRKVSINFYDTICSFLNKEGGIIILGADDDGNVTGIEPDAIEKIKKNIVTALNCKDIINPPVNFPVYETEKDYKKLLYLKIPVSSQVHTHAGVIFDRENDSDIKIKDDDRISDMYFRKKQNFTENEIYPALTYNDLDAKLFDKARGLIASVNSTHPWLEENNMTLLRRALLFRKDFKSGEEGFTLAAALIFGKDLTIQSILPAYKVEALVRKENLDRWDDRITLRTNLIDTYQQLMLFVKKHLSDRFYTEGDQRKDLRELIFREIVGNIIVHREYTSRKSTDLIIYNDRVEAINPNKVIFRGVLQLDTFSPYAKNPNIRKFFSEFRWTDEIGSGVKNVNKYLKLYANGAKPLFIEDDDFKTIIPLARPVLGDRAGQLLEFSDIDKSIPGYEAINILKDISIHPDLNKTEDINAFLFKMGLSWAEKGVKLKELRVRINSELEFSEFKKGSSWAEKGVRLLKKRSMNILKLLIFTLIPAKIDELRINMDFGSRDKLRELYLNPLRKSGLIEFAIKDKPNDPNQKYVITEKGKMFLGGFDV